jgi:hypothetical protein
MNIHFEITAALYLLRWRQLKGEPLMPAASIKCAVQGIASRIALSMVLILCVDNALFGQESLHDRVRASGGASPCRPEGDAKAVQKNSSGSCTGSNQTDDGNTFVTDKDSLFKGRNPWIDGRAYGMRAVTKVPTTTCSTRATSTTMTLGEASTFRNGDGIVCRGAGAALTLSTPSAPTLWRRTRAAPRAREILLPTVLARLAISIVWWL